MAIRELGLQIRTDLVPQLRMEYNGAVRTDLRTLSSGHFEVAPAAGVFRVLGNGSVGSIHIRPNAADRNAIFQGVVSGTGKTIFQSSLNSIEFQVGSTVQARFEDEGIKVGSGDALIKGSGDQLTIVAGVPVLAVQPDTTGSTPRFELYAEGETDTDVLRIQSSGDSWQFRNVVVGTPGTPKRGYSFQDLPVWFSNGSEAAPSISFDERRTAGFFLVPGATPADAEIHLSIDGADLGAIGALEFPILADDGTVSDPSYSFASDPDTGIYLAADGDLSFAVGGARIFRIRPTQVNVYQPLLTSNSVTINDALILLGADPTSTIATRGALGAGKSIQFQTDSTTRLTIADAAITATVSFYAPDAGSTSVASNLKGYSFDGALTTGFDYSGTFNRMRFIVQGVLAFTVGKTFATAETGNFTVKSPSSNPRFALQSGNDTRFNITTSPTFVSISTDTGIIGFSVKTTIQALRLTETAIESKIKHFFEGGSIAAPPIAFRLSPSTGFYYESATPQSLNIVYAGDSAIKLESTKITFSKKLIIPVGAVGTPSLTFDGNETTGLYLVGTGPTAKIHVAVNGVDQGEIPAGGGGTIVASGEYTGLSNATIPAGGVTTGTPQTLTGVRFRDVGLCSYRVDISDNRQKLILWAFIPGDDQIYVNAYNPGTTDITLSGVTINVVVIR